MSGVSVKTKKEIMIAILLAVCLLFGVAVVLLVENNFGTPVFFNGEMKDIRVQITEICASNKSIIATDDGEYPDYIELYNAGETFNLNDFGLANDTGNGKAYSFGDITFESGSYLIVYLDGKNVPFRLNSDGNEYIALVAWDGTVIDSATTVKTKANEVMLRNGADYTVSTDASPGYPNTEEGVRMFRAGVLDGSMALAINEILAANDSVLPDFEGDFCDIIEIKNISAAIVSTKGYYISDSMNDRSRCVLPERELAPGEIMLVFASGKEMTAENGEFHSDFRISVGEVIVLSIGQKHISQAVTKCASNQSISRINGNDGIEYVEMFATPGFENDDAGKEALEETRINRNAPLVISEVLLSQDGVPYGGKLRDVIEICNVSDSEISTSGWFISDSDDDPYKYALPEKALQPNECMLLYAENAIGENVCGFALSSGESVYLTGPDFRHGEFIPCVSAGRGCSRSYTVENGETVYINGGISIGFPNGSEGEKAYVAQARPAEIEISEIVSSNNKYLPGPYKTYHDFVELHNRSDKDIDLSGWFLSDDPEQPRKGALDGVVVPAGAYVAIILSSDGINTPSGYLALDFAINASGETVTLSKGDEIIDCAVVTSLAKNTAFGRANGEDGFSVLASPTPESKNSSRAAEKTASPQASVEPGVYAESVTVELVGEGEIFYTLDCTKPTADSNRYTSPLTLSETTVIRCFAVSNGKLQSEYTDMTFIVNEGDTIEAISIVTTPSNLWDYYTGIYAAGPGAAAAFPHKGANYHKRWERASSVAFFSNTDEGFYENCGLRIFGGYSRGEDKKSLAVFFRSSYGSGELNYRLFEDSDLECYESFVLRNTGDIRTACMRDAMLGTMARELLELDTQNFRPVALYLNGEYWGLYYIREKINEHYVAGHYNCDPDEVEHLSGNGRGGKSYEELLNYAKTHDLSVKENYDTICTMMDVENFSRYLVSEMIIANWDNGNIRFFTYEGGKWRWIFFDVDHAFESVGYNSVVEFLNPRGTGSGDLCSTALRLALLKNKDFKDMFIREMAYQINEIWTAENINRYINRFESLIGNDMQKECERWGYHTYEKWQSSVNVLRRFAENRPGYFVPQVQEYFGLTDQQMKDYGFKIQ
jgi:hypothetical protein